jgi:hypothetical protein
MEREDHDKSIMISKSSNKNKILLIDSVSQTVIEIHKKYQILMQ